MADDSEKQKQIHARTFVSVTHTQMNNVVFSITADQAFYFLLGCFITYLVCRGMTKANRQSEFTTVTPRTR